MRARDPQTDAADSGAVLKRKQYSILVFHSPFGTFADIIQDDRQGGRVVEHPCHRCAIRKNEAKSQVGCRREYEPPPSLADMREFVPPAFAGPFSPSRGTAIAGFFSNLNINYNNRSIEIEYVEKRIVVEDVDGRVAARGLSYS